MMGTSFGMGGFGMGFGLLFWVFVLLALYYVLVGKDKSSKTETAPADILKKRYATGEITRDEFLQMKKEV